MTEATQWFVVFHRKAANRWLAWLAFGRFKHVSAFAYFTEFGAWALYDVTLYRTQIALFKDGPPAWEAVRRHKRAGATIVKIACRYGEMPLKARVAFYCVPAIKHLLGLSSGALRPDSLYRHMLRNGGTIVYADPTTAARP